MENKDKIAFEIDDVEKVNQLAISGEYRQPIYDPHKHKYIMIRKKVK